LFSHFTPGNTPAMLQINELDTCLVCHFTPLKIYTSEDLKPHPLGGDWFQIVTGILAEVSSAVPI